MKTKKHRFIANEIYTASFRMYLNMLLTPLMTLFVIQVLLCITIAFFEYRGLLSLPAPEMNRTLSAGSVSHYYFDFSFGLNPQIRIPGEFRTYFRSLGYPAKRISRRSFQKILDHLYPDHFPVIRTRIFSKVKSSFLLYLLALIYIPFSAHHSRTFTRPTHLRGSRIIDRKNLKKKLIQAIKNGKRHNGLREPIRIGDLPLPPDSEEKHLLLIGATGTGKSVLMNQIIAQLNKRRKCTGSRLILYDIKGEFLSKHFHSGDIVFYPFDERSVSWSFFNEIRLFPDFDMAAHALFIPPETDKDIYWYESAGQVFKAGLQCLHQLGKKKNRDIIEFFNREAASLKADFLKNLSPPDRGAIKHIEKSDSQQAAGILSVLQSRIQFFRYLAEQDGPFSFRDYIRTPKKKGNLFILNIRQNDLIFKPMMTFIMDMMIREVLSLSDLNSFQESRFFFLIDEFASLQKIPSVLDFLTLSRSKGGVLIAANQDLGSIGHIYGDAKKSTFFNNFSNLVTFRVNDPVTAEFISRSIGENEVLKIMDGRQMSPEAMGDRVSLNSQEKTEYLLLPSELMNLRQFQAVIKIAEHGITRVTIPRRFFPATGSPYRQRDLWIKEASPADQPG